jgi:hypothetical protein
MGAFRAGDDGQGWQSGRDGRLRRACSPAAGGPNVVNKTLTPRTFTALPLTTSLLCESSDGQRPARVRTRGAARVRLRTTLDSSSVHVWKAGLVAGHRQREAERAVSLHCVATHRVAEALRPAAAQVGRARFHRRRVPKVPYPASARKVVPVDRHARKMWAGSALIRSSEDPRVSQRPRRPRVTTHSYMPPPACRSEGLRSASATEVCADSRPAIRAN